jgi:hypothetical protein
MLLLLGERMARCNDRSMTSSGTASAMLNFRFDLLRLQMASNVSVSVMIFVFLSFVGLPYLLALIRIVPGFCKNNPIRI